MSKKKAVVTNECVACGVCVKVCPLGAMAVYKGMYALADSGTCVGCGKCATACPACVISIIEKDGAANEEPALV